MPAFDEDEVTAGRDERVEMQRSLGVDVEWIGSEEAEKRNPQIGRRHLPRRELREPATDTSTRRATFSHTHVCSSVRMSTSARASGSSA